MKFIQDLDIAYSLAVKTAMVNHREVPNRYSFELGWIEGYRQAIYNYGIEREEKEYRQLGRSRMLKYNWKSVGPGGCDTHCIEHPCGYCLGYRQCLKCHAEIKTHWLKDGICNGCRNPESIVTSEK